MHLTASVAMAPKRKYRDILFLEDHVRGEVIRKFDDEFRNGSKLTVSLPPQIK